MTHTEWLWASCWRRCDTMWWHISDSVKMPSRCKARWKVQNHKLNMTSWSSEDDLNYEKKKVIFTAEFFHPVSIYWTTTVCPAEFYVLISQNWSLTASVLKRAHCLVIEYQLFFSSLELEIGWPTHPGFKSDLQTKRAQNCKRKTVNSPGDFSRSSSWFSDLCILVMGETAPCIGC